MKIVISESQLKKIIQEESPDRYEKCKQVYTNELLERAKDWYKQKFNDPITRKNWESRNQDTIRKKGGNYFTEKVMKYWVNQLDRLRIKYWNFGKNTDHMVAAYSTGEIFCNCSVSDLNSLTENQIVETFVHEIGHALDSTTLREPLNKDTDIKNTFQGNPNPNEQNYVDTFTKFYDRFVKENPNYKSYVCDPSETKSRIESLRYKNGIKYGQKFPKDVFIKYMEKGINHTPGTEFAIDDVEFLILCWAKSGGRDIESFLNDMDSLVINQNKVPNNLV
jgi:hypothetical protein